MFQKIAWEKEYTNPLFITKSDRPQKDTLRFFKFFKKNTGKPLSGLKILDLGSGTGRNANYLANLGNEVFGLEISPTAIKISRKNAQKSLQTATFMERSIGEKFPFPDNYFDIILDITSSNALTEKERQNYLEESQRVLAPNGLFFVRALCKDSDKNAKNLLIKFPGKEKDTYIMPKSGLIEKVFSQADFCSLYEKFFTLLCLTKKSGYTNFDNQPYKRNYWLAYFKKIASKSIVDLT